ncbi:MAG: hypothetical protein J6B74_03410 [Ruminococcus sp.]|nr:hypothetical protein [Ruminococcus sp.]
MEHIVQFGISIDDKAIADRIEANAQREITNRLYKDVEEAIFGNYRHSPSEFFSKKMDEFLDENCDRILEIAGKRLADKLVLTKRGKAILNKYENPED